MESLTTASQDLLQSIPLGAIAVDTVLALALGAILGWHYLRWAQVLSNKRKLARVFPLIAGTTLLIVTVVKSSLALSLGLIGALSIIRFRTPIKEPEELAYLFLAIAVGVGLGAGQRLATGLVFVLLLAAALVWRRPLASTGQRTMLQISAALEPPASIAALLPRVLAGAHEVCGVVDLRRVDQHDGEAHVCMIVDFRSADDIASLLDRVAQIIPGASVSVIDREAQE